MQLLQRGPVFEDIESLLVERRQICPPSLLSERLRGSLARTRFAETQRAPGHPSAVGRRPRAAPNKAARLADLSSPAARLEGGGGGGGVRLIKRLIPSPRAWHGLRAWPFGVRIASHMSVGEKAYSNSGEHYAAHVGHRRTADAARLSNA